MTEEEFIKAYPRAFHMAEDGSWDSIQKHGLLSTSALLDLYEMQGDERVKIESERRSQSIRVSRPGLPDAVIRDNKPMTVSALGKCLTGGVTPTQWFETLNSRVFFWLSKKRLEGLLGARAYRDRPQTIIELDTASLVKATRDLIQLSAINSGSTIYRPVPRGKDTFQTIEAYPFEKWLAKRARANAVVELTVLGGVKDIMNHVTRVDQCKGGKWKSIWRKV